MWAYMRVCDDAMVSCEHFIVCTETTHTQWSSVGTEPRHFLLSVWICFLQRTRLLKMNHANETDTA